MLSLGEDGFIDTVTAVNRILAKNHHKDQDTQFLSATQQVIRRADDRSYIHLLPSIEDKRPLMGYLYQVLVSMYQTGAGAGHITAVLGYGINAIHPFDNANGRTVRALHTVLSHSTDTDSSVLYYRSLDTVKNTDSLSPEVFEDAVYDQIKHMYGTHKDIDGVLVPNAQFAASIEMADRMSHVAEGDSAQNSDVAVILSAMFDPNVGQIVAGIVKQNPNKSELME